MAPNWPCRNRPQLSLGDILWAGKGRKSLVGIWVLGRSAPSLSSMPEPLAPRTPDLVLTSVRLPGDDACSDVHIRGGAVAAIVPSGVHPGALSSATRMVDFGG